MKNYLSLMNNSSEEQIRLRASHKTFIKLSHLAEHARNKFFMQQLYQFIHPFVHVCFCATCHEKWQKKFHA
jgi:hypothetical protein